jgi:hypothetical protein
MLDVGEGNIQAVTKEGESEPSCIKIPHEFLLKPNDNNISCMVNLLTQNWKADIWILNILEHGLY